jgi:hypothetical protein
MSATSEPPTRSRRWQFTLRTLLFVLLCVGGTLAGFQFGYYRGVLQRRAETMSTRVYSVADLIQGDPPASRPDFTYLIDLITSVIDVESWRDVGGPGSITGAEDSLALVIAQTGSNHDAIAALLADLRAAKTAPANSTRRKLFLQVNQANEHLGHSTAEGDSNVHPVWCDGCRGRMVGTGEELMIWWNNNEIRDTPLRFEDGKTYEIQYSGEFEDGVMGFSGKCLPIRNIKSAKPVGD